jgi:DNA-binding transcriptional MocR family regulator
MTWTPNLQRGDGPRYLQIVGALESDIAAGRVAIGQRLPTHREMAVSLGMSVGTVSRAYALAERRGLISGEVGRGTFVRGASTSLGVSEAAGAQRRINLALNTPPRTGEGEAFSAFMTEVMLDGTLDPLLSYLPHQGLAAHRAVMAAWVETLGLRTSPDQVHVTQGAQHAISIALRLLARPGSAVLTENLPYSGIISLASMEGYDLQGVGMDRHGLIPERLDDAFARTGAGVLFCTPTLQAATGSVMPPERRAEIAAIAARHDAWIVEDDAYGFLLPTPVRPLSTYAPERSIYVMTLSKCLMPSLRIGAMVAPDALRDRIINAIRSTGWMANPIMAEVATRMIERGVMAEQVVAKRTAAVARLKIAADRLKGYLDPMSDAPSYHAWLAMPPGRSAPDLMSRAAQAGITVAAPTPLQPLDPMGAGLRLCLCGAPTTGDLDAALVTLAEILAGSEAMAIV